MKKVIFLIVFFLPMLVWGQIPVFAGVYTAWHEGVGVKDPPPGKRRCIVVVPRKVSVNVRKGEGHFLVVRDTDAVVEFIRTAGVLFSNRRAAR